MKKVILMLAAVCAASMGVCAHAEVIGEVLSTDIGTLIDFEPIKSYNINDYTYIKAEDLRDYGFDVAWNTEVRILSITRNPDAERKICMSKEDINIKKSEIEQRRHLYDVYSTDIKTYLDGEEISAFNVDGETLIQVDYLQKFGNFSYIDGERMVYIDMFAAAIDKAYENAAKSEDLNIAADDYSTTVYNGDTEDGKPCGAGRTTYRKDVPDGLRELNTTVTTGYYSGGVLNGNAYTNVSREERGGSAQGLNESFIYASYKDGKQDGLVMERYIKSVRYSPMQYEYMYKDGIKTGKYRISMVDKEYLYGFMVTEEGENDSDGEVINYEPYENDSPFVKLYRENLYDEFTVEKEDGTLYTNSKSKVFTLTDKVPEPIETTADIDNVKMISSNMDSLGRSGDTGARILLLTENGDVYYERRNFTDEGSAWLDDMDLSEPVKVFSDAKSVYAENSFFVIKNDDSLWFWDDEYYNREKTGLEFYSDGYEYTREPVKICEDVKKVSEGGGYVMVIKNDGTLWARGDNKYGQLGNGTNTNSEEFVKITENVSDVLCRGSSVFALKEDGTLWVWGNNSDGQLGIGNKISVNNPVQITKVYKLK